MSAVCARKKGKETLSKTTWKTFIIFHIALANTEHALHFYVIFCPGGSQGKELVKYFFVVVLLFWCFL